ncbi:kinase-like domain-containing protein [Gilbertella persicaria]|uniref:kinase-like domain-containing protein n=1 Tax=Gilbertella persicaria TaxID=101096 RepID=UPI0022201E56|nr:kinase-like domain-containing protein [Gilbertella persicaria]KAI8047160.1 kinase-like domain-containing protein [Gilbertella persicaria]
MRVVGRGAFGKVRIVEHRESHQLYALKYIHKDECIRMDAARNIIRERVILEQLDHPFLCRLRFAFQDCDYMYMVTDLMLGGDLHFHLTHRMYFSEDVIRFWFAELAAAVKYLHTKRVVHRDIKPQNILMDDQGHVHLADFNIASYLHPNRLLTSNSGTGYYIAPEVYKGGGYNEAVDWWSLGVTLYECIYRKRPFECDTTEDLQAAIRRGYINYPTKDRQVSGECLSVIQGFLEVNPNKRLGYGDAGWAALVRHPFFRSIHWAKLETKQITPPFQPATENNFDLTYDLEELLLEETPLTAQSSKRTKLNKKGLNDKYERDLLMIESKFKYFDFTIFEKYEGFKDPVTMTVGDPPDWVKPAFEGAEQGDILPIKRITTTDDDGPSRSASTSNLMIVNVNKYDQDQNWKRSSMGALRKLNGSSTSLSLQHINESNTSLSEEYALSLQGIRKKQSTRSFRERRERDRKSIQSIQHS